MIAFDPALLSCSRCGEQAVCISYDDKHLVRVRRMSRCKLYRPGCSHICKTETYLTKQDAIDEWNRCQGKVDLG